MNKGSYLILVGVIALVFGVLSTVALGRVTPGKSLVQTSRIDGQGATLSQPVQQVDSLSNIPTVNFVGQGALPSDVPSRTCTITADTYLEPYSYPVPAAQMIGSLTSTSRTSLYYALCNDSGLTAQFDPVFAQTLPAQYWCSRQNSGWDKVAQPTITYQCNQSGPSPYISYTSQNLCSASILPSLAAKQRETFYYLCPDPTDPGLGLHISD